MDNIDDRISRISTNWDLLFLAQQQPNPDFEAQRMLLQRYCGAVYRYLFGAVRDRDVAEEMSQEFALRFVRGDFRRADPQRGRFRDFLKTTLYHLIVDHFRHRGSQSSRSVGDRVETLEYPADIADQEFLEHWRGELLDRAWDGLAELQSSTRQPFHSVLRWRVEHPGVPATCLAEQLGREQGKSISEANVRQILHRARTKFAELLIEEVAGSLSTAAPNELETEIIDLGLLPYCRHALTERMNRR